MFNLSFLPFLKIVDKTYLAMHSGLKKGWIGFLILIIGLGLFLTVKSEFINYIYTNKLYFIKQLSRILSRKSYFVK